MSAGFIDYRKGPGNAGHEGTNEENELARTKSRRRKEKDYSQFTRADLEDEAVDNHDRPVGDFMGDSHLKNKEGDEEYMTGGRRDPFANDKSEQDIGTTNTNTSASRSRTRLPVPAFNDVSSTTRTQNNARSQQQPPADALNYNPSDRHFLHDHTVPLYGTQSFLRRCILEGFQIGSFLTTLLGFNLLVVMAFGAHIGNKMNPFVKGPPRAKVEKDWEQRISGERYSSRAEYYANYFGYECEDIDVETEDGFVLRMHHLTSKKHKVLGHPVILQHGILANSVTFMVNEERSLAFYLLEQGYDVYCSNIRTNFEMPHRHFPRSDPRYWSWAVKEIGIYDLPAIVDYVYKRTNLKPAYIGHSQGTGTMFLGLSRGMRPDMGNKLSSFTALGPAVYAGPVFRTFPFSFIRLFRSRALWAFVFGVREFIPIISLLQSVVPSWLFGHVAFPVFAFIFGFHDHNWLNRQIPKFFRTVGCATSSELLYYYMANLSYNLCIFDTQSAEPWFPASFPPLAIFYGTLDTLVLGKPLVTRIRERETNVRLVKVVALENYEHLDMIWGVNAIPECFVGIKEFIEETKDGYPEIGAPVQERRRRSSSGRRSKSRQQEAERV